MDTVYNIDYIFPNAASRLSSTNYTVSDGYKIAIDLDTKFIYTLIDWQNNIWSKLTGNNGGGALGVAGGDLQGIYPNPQVKDLTISGEVKGSILYFDGTNWIQLSPSDDGYVLTTHGSNENPTWTKVNNDFNNSAGGDLTGNYPNPTIANDAVTTIKISDNNITSAKIADNNVTFSKIQNISTNSLLGRDSAGTGNVEQISLNPTLEMDGTGSLQRAAVSGDITIAAGSNTAAITSGSIINSDINASANIDLSKLELVSANILIGNPNSIQSSPVEITLDSTLNFNGTSLRRGAISGDVSISAGSNNSIVTDLTITGETQGSILYFNGSNWVHLSPGVLGQYLQTQGLNSNPQWATLPTIITDHGNLSGLSDDDHTQYLLASGLRSVSGNLTVNGNIIVTGTVDGYDLNNTFGIINNDINVVESSISTTSGNLSTHTSNSNNPHNTSIANIGSGTLAQLNLAISDANLDAAGTARPPTGTAGGDLSGNYPSPTIVDNAVTTTKVLNNNITFAKMQTIATDTLLGRDTAGTGNVENISLNSTLQFTGSGSIGRSAISGDVTIASGSNSATVTDLTITGEVQGSVLYFNGTNWVHLAPGTAGDVLQTQGTNSNPQWATIGSGSATPSGAAGGDLGGSYPNPTVINLTIPSQSQGDVLYFNGTSWVSLPAGTSGQLLQTNGSGSNPTWVTIGGTNTFSDSLFRIQDNTDSTKQIAFEASGITTATTRTITVPDANVNLTNLVHSGDSVSGDLTGTYSSPTIANDAVTFAKIQNITTDRLLGRDTAGSGNTEEISLNSTLEFSGSGSIQRAALTGDVTATAGSNATTIANNAVTTVKVLNNNITLAKIQTIATDRLLGRDTASTGNVEEISLDSTLSWSGAGSIGRSAISGDVTIALGSNTATVTDLTITGESQGSVLYFDGTNWVRLSPGTNGQYLQTQGTSANPTWSNISPPTVFNDSLFRIQDNTDATKQLAFEVSGITTATTRTITVPNSNITIDDVSGTRTPTDNTVSTNKVVNDAITFAKMQNITTDRLLGRDTATTGDIEEISLNSTLEFSGSSSIGRAALTGDVTAASGSNTTSIANNAVTTVKILDSNITSAKIADNNVTFAKIQTIATDTLLGRDTAGTGNVENITLNSTLEMTGSGALQRAAISGDITIAAGSNTSAISSGVIVNGDINASAGINLSKLESITTSTLVGNPTGVSATPSLITLDSTLNFNSTTIRRSAISGDVTIALGSNTATVTDLTITGESQGSVLYFDGTNWVRLAPGTSGNVLQTNGVGANPTWESVSSGGGAGSDTTAIHDNQSGEIAAITSKASPTTSDYLLIEDAAATNAKKSITIGTLPFLGSTASAGGDLTGNYPNPTITNNAVSFAKMQTISTDTLLGRDTAGTGNIENISLNSTLEMTGSGSLQRSAISGDITIAAGSNTAAISSGVIVNNDVNASAGINLSKLESITASTLVGNPTGAGAVPSLITLDSTLNFNGTTIRRSTISGDVTIAAGSNTATVTDLTITSEAQGDILYFNGTNWVRLAPGTNGHYLQTQGAAANPQWAAVVGGGGNTFSDSLFRIQDNADATKQLAFEVSGIATATTRTITVPNSNITIDDVSGTRTPTDNTVSTIKLIDNNVTFAKMQTIATDTLLGRDAAGTGNVENITLNSTLEMTGSGALQRAAISGDITITAGSNTADISSGVIVNTDINASAAIDFSKLATIATNSLLGRDTAGTGALEVIAVSNGLEFSGTGGIIRSALTGDITAAAGSNTTAITAGVIVNNDVNASAGINLSKLESITASTLIGNPTGAGAVPSLITLDSTLNFNGTTVRRSAISGDVTIALGSNTATVTDLTITSEAQGDILYFNGTNWVRLAAGTNGHYLQTQGAAANPQWAAVAGGGGGGSPGGSTTQIQYNNAGSFAGATNVTINNNDLTLSNNATPTTPPTDTIKLFGRKLCNRMFPAVVGPSGLDYALQPNLFRNKITLINGNGTNNITQIGIAATTVGTATARTAATTNIFTRMRKTGYVSAATAGSLASLRGGTPMCFPGNGSGLGGFFFCARFGFTDAAAVSGVRGFVGLRNSTSAPTNVEPNTITNCVGIAQLSTDTTQLYIVYGGSAAQTAIGLGTNFPPFTSTPGINNAAPIDICFWSSPAENAIIYYRVENLATGNVTEGTLSGTPGTTTPSNSTYLSTQMWRCNNATALACAFDIISMYLETDI